VTQLELLRYVVSTLERLRVPYAIVGSFASGIWGEPRMTLDIDVVVQLLGQQVAGLVDAFPTGEFYVSPTAADEAVRTHGQFNVIHPTSGNKVDFMVVGGSAWATAQLARRRRIELLPDFSAEVAAPDDVILGKLLYYREGGSEKHLRDIAGIMKRSGELVDPLYVRQVAEQLGAAEVWQRIVKELDA
jgi:hypothetical protein